MMHKRTRQHGFTIVELIVTMSILGLMLFLVNRLFNDTSQAVTTSVQTSKTIAASRSINEQFTIDADAMIGPGQLTDNPGYIVIIQQRLNNVDMLDPRNLSKFTVPQLRSDQIVFIRDAEGMRSMTPQNASSYRTNLVGLASDRAKVWYGHAIRTLPNGDRIGGAANQQLGGANAGLDSVGSNFILGRQAMLFNPTNTVTGDDLVTASAGITYAQQPWQLSLVDNNTTYPYINRSYMGLTDVTLRDYSTMPTVLTNGARDCFGAADFGTANPDNDDYLSTAYIWPNAETVRLRVNTAPDPEDTDYATWAIAQGHAIFAQSCSEIVIDFAADLNGNGRIDRAFGGTPNDTSGAIYWYDALRQTGSFSWSPDLSTDISQPFVLNEPNRKAFVFRVDDFTPYNNSTGSPAIQNHSNWPYLIRIRYRLHDTRGRLTSNYNEPNVDNNGDGSTTDVDDDKISGRWFERIIRVPRP